MQTNNIKRNRKPSVKREKAIEKVILDAATSIGMDLSIVDSKARLSPVSGAFKRSETEVGFPDLVGNLSSGIAAYVELKAPGKRRNISKEQFSFLTRKLAAGCFACVVDSETSLYEAYMVFLKDGSQGLFKMICELRPDFANDFFPEQFASS